MLIHNGRQNDVSLSEVLFRQSTNGYRLLLNGPLAPLLET